MWLPRNGFDSRLAYHKARMAVEADDGMVVCTEHCDKTGRMNNFWNHFDTHFGFVQK